MIKLLNKYLDYSINLIKEIIKTNDDLYKKELIKVLCKYNEIIIKNNFAKVLLIRKKYDYDDPYDKSDIDAYFWLDDLSILNNQLKDIILVKEKLNDNFFKITKYLQKKYDNISEKNLSRIFKFMDRNNINISEINNYINYDNDRNIMLTIKYFTKRKEVINCKPMKIDSSINKKLIITLIKKYLQILSLDKIVKYKYYERSYDENEKKYTNKLKIVNYDLDEYISKLDLNKILKSINKNEEIEVFKNNKLYVLSHL
jgi:hypothetical protein